MFVTRLTDSEERVITAARGGARGGAVTFFPRQREVQGPSWVGSFHSFAVGLAERVYGCSSSDSRLLRAQSFYSSIFFLYPNFIYNVHLENSSRKSSSRFKIFEKIKD